MHEALKDVIFVRVYCGWSGSEMRGGGVDIYRFHINNFVL
ncbi:hypothetical protein FLA_0768 [Filimonas lacunae]|nr:hypothetical protein FLA_0768 [Filimonas lacunae]